MLTYHKLLKTRIEGEALLVELVERLGLDKKWVSNLSYFNKKATKLFPQYQTQF